MLTESAYLMGFAVYTLAALFALYFFQRWFMSRLSLAARLLPVFPLAALLLTPAYTEPGSDTMAPALIVTVFQAMTEGIEGASHAIRPLGLFTAGSLVLAVILWLLLRRRSGPTG